ncbi:MAG TPA: hypothetical protein VD903_12665 [Pseudonocardia sp.]|nr:hypothetical protein [Pseudonocardia sp.]
MTKRPLRRAAPRSSTRVDIDARLHERFPDLRDVFLEPVPRSDPVVRRRVLERYGRAGADRLRGDRGSHAVQHAAR